ncbi:hypothetical protein [Streptomyces chartreusis]|uniref:Uncharacterized protein n=1 Tax=Streptomyces chartreusis TaxID=1969 RepID=A0A7I0Y8Z5_STRCX|nr:hypothetical protein [Streptomyces chartreusis]QKZ15976.1 hypothetical protein HUT05_00260 [Streptomyces chartreusis]
MSPTSELTQKTLTELDFRGFVPFRELTDSNVPTGHEIYAVIRTDTSPRHSSPPALPDASKVGTLP